MEPLSMSKGRALLHQQFKTEQVVTLAQAPCSLSLQQLPKADTWERFKNTASTDKISLQAPAAQELPKPRNPCIW